MTRLVSPSTMRLFSRLALLVLVPFALYTAYTQCGFVDQGGAGALDGAEVHVDVQRGYSDSKHAWASQCGPCGEHLTEFCEMMGPVNMAKTVAHSGSNIRLRRALHKMRSGKPFNIAVVGGSVSGGHGLRQKNNEYAETNMHVRVFRHLENLFPSPNGEIVMQGDGKVKGGHGFVNGAQGGTGSDYFSRCYSEHIPEDVDLIFIELAVNDEPLQQNQRSYELLVRTLLDLPSQPAIVNMLVFSLSFAQIIGGGDQHAGLYEFYDLPAITIRSHLAPQCFDSEEVIRDFFVENKKTEDLSGVDLRHISPKGHELTANVTTAYLDRQLCEMDHYESLPENRGKSLDQLYPFPKLPRQMLNQKFELGLTVPRMVPNCFSANAKTHKLVPKAQTGWRQWNWEAKNYWIADKPGSKISFDFSTTSMGIIEVSYQRSAIFGLGSVGCWVDDDKHRTKYLEGYWHLPFNIGRMETIRNDLSIGDHVLHCELLDATADPKGGHEFRLIAIMSI